MEIVVPHEAMGVKWPLKLYICQQCARPTLFKEDRCCSGFMHEIEVVPTTAAWIQGEFAS